MTVGLDRKFGENPSTAGRVLLIDDDALTRERLALLLRNHYLVDTASDGESGIRAINQHSYDLILLDLLMDDVSGFDVLRRIRRVSSSTDLPIIITSALAEAATIVAGLEVGANDYVTKPFDPSILLARIETQIALKRLIDEREEHIKQLERANQLRLQLTRIASHDLKDPLHNITIVKQLLKESFHNNPEINMMIDTLDSAVLSMRHVIETFLDVVELQSSSVSPDSNITLVLDVVMRVFMQYEVVAQNKKIDLIYRDITGVVLGDEPRMIQALGNLVSNALKYSPLGKTVTIWTEKHGDWIRLLVGDEGPGIPAHERDRLFTEFSKLSTKPTGHEPRTGLGLWIVKQLVNAQGGRVGAKFPKTGGSIFWIEFPIISHTQPTIEHSA